MEGIKKFFECLLPVTACNLSCEYCYVIQRNQNKKKIPDLDYPPEVIGQALTKERLGGTCYFSICGAGETFLPEYLYDIIFQLLKNGHYVNVTTNGTITKRLRQLESLPKEWRLRLHVSFSLHYLELKRLNLLDVFFENVHFVKELGCSFIVQLNLYDGYVPYLNEIKELCLQKIGAYPQIAATRKEESLTKKIELMTDYTTEEYRKFGKEFESPLFDFTMKNFNVKRREFCYAGDWSYVLNLKTGILKRCYASCLYQNIFKDIEKPLKELAVGNSCASLFCLNSSHFMSLGIIPVLKTPSYADLRNRTDAGWYSDTMQNFLSGKLSQENKEYRKLKKIYANVVGLVDRKLYLTYNFIKNKVRSKK